MTTGESAGRGMKKGTGQPHRVAPAKNNRYISVGATLCGRPFHRHIRLLQRLLPIVILMLLACTFGPLHAWPEVPFKHEFEDICSRTSEAESLSVRELESLIDRCDKLRPAIEKAGEPERKIYLKRLIMCKDLFVYVLESRKAAHSADK